MNTDTLFLLYHFVLDNSEWLKEISNPSSIRVVAYDINLSSNGQKANALMNYLEINSASLPEANYDIALDMLLTIKL